MELAVFWKRAIVGKVMEFEIVHEAPHYVVVHKPAGMLTHPSKPEQGLTLWDHLKRALACDLQEPGRQISFINRLDRETSGLVLAALTSRAARAFGLAMQSRLIHKEYLALVRGWPAEERWTVDASLDAQRRHEDYIVQLRQIAHPAGYPARTEFAVEARFTRGSERFALVRAWPHTGRLHQIRVHLSLGGHPVVGDKLYGPPPAEALYLEFIETDWTPALESRLLLRSHALHSAVLGWGTIRLPDENEPDGGSEVIPAAEYRLGVPPEWDAWHRDAVEP